jgi:LacI family transcriptional regulator
MTIKDIAKQCGVSVSTVSRVLNNHPDVSRAVREKILEAVRQSNYIPNKQRGDLVKSSSDAIGLVVRGVSNPFFVDIIKTVDREIEAAGYTMVMRQINSGEDELQCGAVMEREKKLRGIVFLSGRSDYTPADIAPINVPFVCCAYENNFGTLPENAYSSVSIEDEAAAYRAVSALIGLGHRRIAALVSDTDDRSISELRYRGYVRALGEHEIGLDKTLVACAHAFGMEAAYVAMAGLLERTADFTAVFTIADAMAIAAMKALANGGRPVPDACSVIGIDGLQLSEYVQPTLTTLRQPGTAMGAESVRILLDMIEGRAGNRHVTMDTAFVEGGSVRRI